MSTGRYYTFTWDLPVEYDKAEPQVAVCYFFTPGDGKPKNISYNHLAPGTRSPISLLGSVILGHMILGCLAYVDEDDELYDAILAACWDEVGRRRLSYHGGEMSNLDEMTDADLKKLREELARLQSEVTRLRLTNAALLERLYRYESWEHETKTDRD